MVVIRDAAFRVVNQSRNLRGILEYSRSHTVEVIDLYRNKDGETGQLGIRWADGATTITDFASYTVMVRWVNTRRNLRDASQRFHDAKGH